MMVRVHPAQYALWRNGIRERLKIFYCKKLKISISIKGDGVVATCKENKSISIIIDTYNILKHNKIWNRQTPSPGFDSRSPYNKISIIKY